MNMAGHSTSVYLLPGMSVKINAPGYFIKHGEVLYQCRGGSVETRQLEQGFVVDDQTVGEIEAVANEPAVIYKHKKPEENIITFYALTGEKGYVYVISVPIHDHSSIVQGGPGFGSFFSDSEEESDGS